MAVLGQIVDRTVAGTVERLVDVGRDHPVPAELAEVDAQRIATAVALVVLLLAVVRQGVAFAPRQRDVVR